MGWAIAFVADAGIDVVGSGAIIVDPDLISVGMMDVSENMHTWPDFLHDSIEVTTAAFLTTYS